MLLRRSRPGRVGFRDGGILVLEGFSFPVFSLLTSRSVSYSYLRMVTYCPWMFPLFLLVRRLPLCYRVLSGLRNTVANHGRDPSRRVAPMCLIGTLQGKIFMRKLYCVVMICKVPVVHF